MRNGARRAHKLFFSSQEDNEAVTIANAAGPSSSLSLSPCLYMSLIPFSTCALFALFFQASCYLRSVAGNFKLAPPPNRAHHVYAGRKLGRNNNRFIHFYIHLQNDDPVAQKKFRVLHAVCRLAAAGKTFCFIFSCRRIYFTARALGRLFKTHAG
jgi:hypothetical protein